jgi:putative transcriptional regulator
VQGHRRSHSGVLGILAFGTGREGNQGVPAAGGGCVRLAPAPLSLTQEQFAARFGFSVATLRHWERGYRDPSGASLVLLNVIDRNPGAVLAALQP